MKLKLTFLLVILLATPMVFADITSNLVAYWKLDDGSGTAAFDSSLNGKHGTLVNSPTWATGKFGGGVTFNGSNNYISLPQTLITTPITYSVWFKTTSTGVIFSDASSAVGETPSGWNPFIYIRGDGKLSLLVYEGSSIPVQGILSSGTVNDGAWHHAVLVINGTTNQSGYLDGQFLGTRSYGGQSTYSLQLGTGYTNYWEPGNYSWNYFNGTLDDVRVYGRALSSADVTELYNYNVTGDIDSNLVGYWRFNDGSGTVALDSSGYGNNGTLYGNGSYPTWQTGKFGGDLNFNGLGGYPNHYIETPFLQNAVTAYSISVWVKTTDSGAAKSFVNNRGYGVSLTLGMGTTGGGHGGAGKVGFEADGSGLDIGISSTQTINDGAWHHVVGTWAASSGTAVATSQFKIYIDGSEASVTTGSVGSTNSPLTGNGPTQLAYHAQWYTFLNGELDDIRIYNRALSTSDVNELYNYTPPSTPQVTFSVYESETSTHLNNLTVDWNVNAYDVSNKSSPFSQDVNTGTYSITFSKTGYDSNTIILSVTTDKLVTVYLPKNANIDSNLLGYWKFDDGSGSTAVDSSGYGHNGSLVSSPTWGTGKVGGDLSFSGSNYVLLSSNAAGTSLSAGGKDEWSMSAWVKGTSFSGEKKVFGIWDDTYGLQYLLSFNSGGYPISAFSSSCGYVIPTSTSAINTGQWYHLAATYKRNTVGGATIYVNGVKVAFANTPNCAIVTNNTQPIAIGTAFNSYPSVAAPFVGEIDDIRIYDRALTENDILALYNYTGSDCTPPASGNWTIDDNSNCVLSTNTTLTGNLYLVDGTLTVLSGVTLNLPATKKIYVSLSPNNKDQKLKLRAGAKLKIKK